MNQRQKIATGITIGYSRQQLINTFGKSSKTRSLNNVCTIMSKKRPDGKACLYRWIRFWICKCNDQIYAITLPWGDNYSNLTYICHSGIILLLRDYKKLIQIE